MVLLSPPKEQGSAPKNQSFKNSSGGFYTKALFFEFDDSEKLSAMFTLKDFDHIHKGILYPSLRRMYVEKEDPTEYFFATECLDSWLHWKSITKQEWFQEYLLDWREELETRIRAKALLRIREFAAKKTKESHQADKLLLSAGWLREETKSKVGRPTKAKIKEEADRMFKEKSILDEDFNRIMQ